LKESARSKKQEARGNQESGIRKKTASSVLNFREVLASFLTHYQLPITNYQTVPYSLKNCYICVSVSGVAFMSVLIRRKFSHIP
jgi:hypothetical protein